MKFLTFRKDGGPESHSFGFFFIEIKRAFSLVLLEFTDGSRDAYHTHAFNAVSWVLRGKLIEYDLDGTMTEYRPSIWPIFTPRTRFHKVVSVGTTWAISFRGPWLAVWKEYLPKENDFIALTHGRKIVGRLSHSRASECLI